METYLTEIVTPYLGTRIVIPIESITHLTASDRLIEVHHSEGMHLVSDTLKRLERVLPGFVRIHKGMMVRTALVKRAHRDAEDLGRGLAYCTFSDAPLRVSRTYYMGLKRALADNK